jgi:hypothetical protein
MSRKTDKPTTSRKTRRATVAPHAVEAEPAVIEAEPAVIEAVPSMVPSVVDAEPRTVSPAERNHMIAVRAFRLAAERGFMPGGELEDWLTAEREIDRALAN